MQLRSFVSLLHSGGLSNALQSSTFFLNAARTFCPRTRTHTRTHAHTHIFFHTRISYSGGEARPSVDATPLGPGSSSTSGGIVTVDDRGAICSSGCTLVTGAPRRRGVRGSAGDSCASRCRHFRHHRRHRRRRFEDRCCCCCVDFDRARGTAAVAPPARQQAPRRAVRLLVQLAQTRSGGAARNSLLLPHESVTTFMEKVFSKLLESLRACPG